MRELPEFEELCKLSPEELQKVREDYTKEIIESCNDERQRARLEGLQFKINMEIRKAKTPMAACIKLSQMMHDSFAELRSALSDFTAFKPGESLYNIQEESKELGKDITTVLKFVKDRKNDDETST